MKNSISIADLGILRFAAAVPKLRVADVEYNCEEILKCYALGVKEGASVVLFPELSLSAYSCGDLFFQNQLIRKVATVSESLAQKVGNTILICGAPIHYENRLYNVALVMQNGKILGAVPKSILPNYREFYEKRQFTSGRDLRNGVVKIGSQTVPFGVDLIFSAGELLKFGIEICEDLWSVLPPSSSLALNGANMIFNLSAGTELATKAAYRRDLVRQQSARCICGYLYAAAGVHESTTDAVFGGHALIAENGRIAGENRRFDRESNIIYADIDLERLESSRRSESSFFDNASPLPCRNITLTEPTSADSLEYFCNPKHPFVPSDSAPRTERCQEIFDIQCAGLAKRIEHSHSKSMVIGISGGLDSTLALLVAVECCKLLKRPFSDIIAVTMPGFGTTDRTYNNAVELCQALEVTLLEINIKDACLQHFKDINHDPDIHDVTYENVQARERTQLLMDLANKHGGIVVGTGDLSEIALGWSTYNGDHMSMYAVNASVPKTLIRYLISSVAESSSAKIAELLADIIDTPVSPELLPPSKDGKIDQKTESLIGPYELHDYFLYHFIKYGAEVQKIEILANQAFSDCYSPEEISKNIKLFVRRFFQQQFKRICMPDGPKVGTIALSPRGDWRMPSDASAEVWSNGLL